MNKVQYIETKNKIHYRRSYHQNNSVNGTGDRRARAYGVRNAVLANVIGASPLIDND